MFKSTPKEGINNISRNVFFVFKMVYEASNCSGILFKLFVVQFYMKKSQFILINKVTGL